MSYEITFTKYYRAEEAFHELLSLPEHLSLNPSAEHFYQQRRSSLYRQLSCSEESLSSFAENIVKVLEKLFNYFLDMLDKLKSLFDETYLYAKRLDKDIDKVKDVLSNPVRFKKVPDEIYSRVRNAFSLGNSNVSISDGLGILEKYVTDSNPEPILKEIKSIMETTIDRINSFKKDDIETQEKFLKNRSNDLDSLFYEIKNDFGLVDIPKGSSITEFRKGKGEYIQSMLLPGGYQVLGFKAEQKDVSETAFVSNKIVLSLIKTTKLEPEIITPLDNNNANRIVTHCENISKHVTDHKREIDRIITDIHRAAKKGIAACKFLKTYNVDNKRDIIEQYLSLLSHVRTLTIDLSKVVNALNLQAVKAALTALLAINRSIEV